MTNKEIGDRIRFARENANLNKKELAQKIKVADSTIKRYEDGEINKIKMPIIESIANVLSVNPMWIIGKSNNIEKNNSSEIDSFVLDPDIRRIQRARNNMNTKEKEKMMNILRASFEDYFSDDYEDDDLNE